MTDEQRVQHILGAIKKLEDRVNGLAKPEFINNDVLSDSIIYQLIIIGEAANHLSEETKERHSALPWHAIVGFRNILTHEYYSVDLDLVWGTLQQNLPKLKSALQKELTLLQQRASSSGRTP